MRGRYRFTKKERICSSQEFREILKYGKRVTTENYTLFIKENERGFPRLGIIIKKEVGRATLRNRVKRYIREFFRLNKHKMGGPLDMVIMVKKGSSPKKYWEVEEELSKVIE